MFTNTTALKKLSVSEESLFNLEEVQTHSITEKYQEYLANTRFQRIIILTSN